jgi:hypothetical protein
VSLALPYRRLNLRRNPFGELDLATRAELAVAEVRELVDRIDGPGAVIQLLGGSGRGKTTLMLAIRARFPSAPYVKVLEAGATRIPHGHPLFLDDAHLLTPRRRKRLFARAVSFVIATHVDLSLELEGLGLQVTSLRPAQRLDATTLELVFRRRLEAMRRAPGPIPRVRRDTVERLVAAHGEDVRAMEWALYEGIQRLEEVGDVEV